METLNHRSPKEEIQELWNCLEDIAIDVGDNRDCLGNYISDRIRNLVKEFKQKIELTK